MNIKNSVQLLGYKENPYKYLKKSDLFVTTSFFEGFNCSLVEALALGTPIITTNSGGVHQQIDKIGYF